MIKSYYLYKHSDLHSFRQTFLNVFYQEYRKVIYIRIY